MTEGPGNDWLDGGAGEEWIYGEDGDHAMNGGTEVHDRCDGGAHVAGDTAVNSETVINVP